jgi:hypothetical protein
MFNKCLGSLGCSQMYLEIEVTDRSYIYGARGSVVG